MSEWGQKWMSEYCLRHFYPTSHHCWYLIHNETVCLGLSSTLFQWSLKACFFRIPTLNFQNASQRTAASVARWEHDIPVQILWNINFLWSVCKTFLLESFEWRVHWTLLLSFLVRMEMPADGLWVVSVGQCPGPPSYQGFRAPLI